MRLILYIPQSRGGSRADGRLTCLLEKFNLSFIPVFGVISCTAKERVHDFLVVIELFNLFCGVVKILGSYSS